MTVECPRKVLVVEDERITALHLSRRLQHFGFTVIGPADEGWEAIRLAESSLPDVVLMDIVIQGTMDGIQTVEELHQRLDVPVVYLTANSDPATLQRAKLTHPAGFLMKPFEDREIQNTLEIAIYRHRNEAVQRLYQRAIAASVSAIFIADAKSPDLPILQVNPAFERMSGYVSEEAEGRCLWSFLNPEANAAAVDQLRDSLAGQRSGHATLLCDRKDGSAFWSELTLSGVPDASGRVLHFIGVQHDVTALRDMEAQLRQAQKLQSIGQLAAGIAHEINTPMQYIGDNTRFVRDAFRDLRAYAQTHAALLAAAKSGPVPPAIIAQAEAAARAADFDYLNAEISQAVQQSLEGIESVSRIVRAMKEFSHPGVAHKIPVNLNQAVENTLTVCRNEWKYVAEVVTDLDPALPEVACLPGEINQVLLNLVVNASHAIAATQNRPIQGKGTIAISTHAQGRDVEIRVRDNGCGIQDAVRHRIFDPFFTTKNPGQGTGQGLAMAWRVVVEKHGGSIRVDSQPGRGATFILRLPVDPDAAHGSVAPPNGPPKL